MDTSDARSFGVRGMAFVRGPDYGESVAPSKKSGSRRFDRCTEGCRCWRCYANVLGSWFDEIGHRVGGWKFFATITVKTNQLVKPTFGITQSNFGLFVDFLEQELNSHVAYIVTDERGRVGLRLHQHALLAAPGLENYPRRDVEFWLRHNSGFGRVLPFERGAAFYLARYIGRHLAEADWDLRIGTVDRSRQRRVEGGRVVVASSADLSHDLFHQTLGTRKR